MTINNLIGVIILSLSLISCEKTTPDPINVNTVDNKYDITLSQSATQNDILYYLHIKNSELSDCQNATLQVEQTIDGNNIVINIIGNTNELNCEDGSIYTEYTVELPSQVGQYQLEFINGELSSTYGTLEITDTDVILEADDLGGLFFENQNLKVIPDYLLWGYFADNNPDTSTEAFLEEIMMNLGFGQIPFDTLEEGDYSEFKVNASGEIEIEDVKLDHVTFAFNIEDELRWEKITTLLPLNATSFPRLKYLLKTWDGRVVAN